MRSRYSRCLLVLTLGSYLIFEVWNFLFTRGVGDEFTYFGVGRDLFQKFSQGQYSFWTQENAMGYGSLYWNFYLLSFKLSSALGLEADQSDLLIKVFALLVTLGVPLAMMSRNLFNNVPGSTRNVYLALSVYFLCPMAWWTGKITGPETFSMGLAFWGMAFFLSKNQQRTLLGAFLLGLGVGVKVTAAPILVFSFLVYLWNSPRKRRAFPILFAVGFGFLFANPYLLFAPENHVTYLQSLDEPGTTLSNFRNALILDRMELNFVYSGGLVYWSLSSLSLIVVFALIAVRTPVAIAVAFFTSLLVTLGMFCFTSRSYGWYWFPMITLIPTSLLWIRLKDKKEFWLLILALLLSVPGSLTMIYNGFLTKYLEAKIHQQAPEILQGIAECFKTNAPIDGVVDYFDTVKIDKFDPSFYNRLGIQQVRSFAYELNWNDIQQIKKDMAEQRWAVILGPRAVRFQSERLPFIRALGHELKPRSECSAWDDRIRVLFFEKL
jgi:hypothetical protein